MNAEKGEMVVAGEARTKVCDAVFVANILSGTEVECLVGGWS
jgi:hypothetical protein